MRAVRSGRAVVPESRQSVKLTKGLQAGARRALVVWSIAMIAIVVASAPAVAGVDKWTNLGPEGANVFALAIDPVKPNTLYAGTNGGGVFKSTNGGTSWAPAISGLTETYVLTLAIDPTTPAIVYAGTGSAGVFKSTDGGTSWAPGGLPDDEVDALAIDPATPTTLYAASFFEGIFKSTNSGTSWALANGGLTGRFVQALAIDPVTVTTLYAGTEGNGVFKSTDGGTSWTPANTGLATASVRALAINPTTPTTLYAGTDGDGVFKSTDGGTSWAPSLVDFVVAALAIDRATPTTLYAGTENDGLYKSTDAGTSWQPAASGITNPSVYALAIDPVSPITLYAGTYGNGVFKSTDRGTSWIHANAGLATASVFALAIDPATPTILYAGTYGGGMFKSTNGGTKWVSASDGLAPRITTLAIDPATPATLYAGTFGSGVFKSSNGGTSWASRSAPISYVSALAIDPVTPTTLYAGTDNAGPLNSVVKSTDGGASWAAATAGITNHVYALAIDPVTPTVLYAGTSGGGIFKSTNAGTSWTSVAGGVSTPYVVHVLAIDPAATTTVYAGTETGKVLKSTDGGASWAPAASGLPGSGYRVMALAIDRATPGTLYAGTFAGNGSNASSSGVFKSTDGGNTWAHVATGLTSTNVLTLAIDPVTPTTLYAGTGGGVFRLSKIGESVSTSVGPGASCSTDTDGPNGSADGVTAFDPIETTVYTPNAGLCAIDEEPATGTPLTGYSVFGYAVTITAPPASAGVRLKLVFEIAGSIIPPGQTYNTIQLLKDGVRVGPCIGGNDPCMERPVPLPNGGVKLTIQTSTASVWSLAVPTLDSYLCYASVPTKGTPPGEPSLGHLFADTLETERFDLLKPGPLCLAATRDGAPISDGATALETAALKADKVCSDTGLACRNKKECTAPANCDAQAKFAVRKNVTVFNALGAIVVDATKPATALLPSGTSASTPPGTPNPGLDTFTCYTTKPHTKVCTGDPTRACDSDDACGDAGPCFAAFAKNLTVRLDEPLATPNGKTFAVKKPTALCLPAALDGAPQKVPSVAFQCYAIAPAKKQPKHVPVTALAVTSPTLGALQRDTTKDAAVCLPSEIVIR